MNLQFRSIPLLLSTLVVLLGSTPSKEAFAQPGRGGPPPTWTQDIAPIFQNRCQECHNPGDRFAPMSLMTFDDVRPYARAIRAKIHRKEMPPWAAAPSQREFLHNRSLPQEELDRILFWIEARAPRGPGEPPAPPELTNEPWEIGTPDRVVDMGQEVRIPAEGVLPQQFFQVPLKLEKETLLTAVDIRPGNPDVVREIVLYVQNPEDGTPVPDAGRFGRGRLGFYARGETWTEFAPGEGKLLKPGSQLVFRILYTPNGTATSDRSVAALKFREAGEDARQVVSRGIGETKFAIPQHVAEFPIYAVHEFTGDAEIWRLRPEMHYRGKDFKFIAHYPDGRDELLLHVDRYNYDWQVYYYPKERIPIPAGTVIECIAMMNNSHENPDNPGPHETVIWGEQPTDEKMIGWVDYVLK